MEKNPATSDVQLAESKSTPPAPLGPQVSKSRPSLARALRRCNPSSSFCTFVRRLRDKYVSCCVSASERGDIGQLVYGSAVYTQPDVVSRCSVDRRPADDDPARISTDWAGDFLSESARRAYVTSDKSAATTPSNIQQGRHSFSRYSDKAKPVPAITVRSSFS